MPLTLTTDNYETNITPQTNAIIDFSAQWCGPCKRMKPEYEKAEEFIKSLGINLPFYTVDVDEEDQIAVDYSIESMPTLILIKEGDTVSKKTGYVTYDNILVMIGAHFDIPKSE